MENPRKNRPIQLMGEREVMSLIKEDETEPQGLRAHYPAARRERTRMLNSPKEAKSTFQEQILKAKKGEKACLIAMTDRKNTGGDSKIENMKKYPKNSKEKY